jgi:hypothetical protein
MKEAKMGEEKEAPRKLSRKDFVKGAAAVAGAGALASCAPAATPGPAPAATCPPAPDCPPSPECPAPWLPAKWDYEADLVVVGTGGGALTAAIEAADAGASVLLLEKAPEQYMGGNTKVTGSFSIGRTREAAYEYLTSQCWGTVADEEVIRAQVDATFELPDWIAYLGREVRWRAVEALYPLIPGAEAWAGTDEEPNAFRVNLEGEPTEPHTWNFFRDAAAERGVSVEAGNIMCLTPATELIQDGITKEILGVKALAGVTFTPPDFAHYSGGTEIYVKAKKGVILACGGAENNEEHRKNFSNRPHSGFITQYGTPFNTGDGIVMAQRVGAKLWHMNKVEAHDFACVPASKEIGSGVVVDAFGDKSGAKSGIIVNRDGKRFMNEFFYSGHTEDHRVYWDFEFKHLPVDDYEYSDYRHVPMYWIWDDSRMNEPLRRESHWVDVNGLIPGHTTEDGGWSQDNQEELAKGWFIKADTIEELAQKIVVKDFFGRVVGMDAAGLVETINKYNQYCAAGKDLDFGRRAESLTPISVPPFYAMEICECQTNTCGGPEHNKYWQTLDLDGKSIARLYNIGELGSLYGHLYTGAGNIPETYASGRVAAKHALALEPWDA